MLIANKCAEAIAEFQQGFGFSKSEIRVVVPEDYGNYAISTEEKEANETIFDID